MKKKKLNAEIANGRLAMMAIIGMFFQDPAMVKFHCIIGWCCLSCSMVLFSSGFRRGQVLL